VDNPCHIWKLRTVPPPSVPYPGRLAWIAASRIKKRRESHGVPKAVLTTSISQVVAIVESAIQIHFPASGDESCQSPQFIQMLCILPASCTLGYVNEELKN
jgi:hypothetical protein